ncbi:23S rRNA pseudouridine955/2504/2580 synthase [Desulfobaculum xiamenense]|uniref:23S rRNA pseudouridine955/2504/2580 synthase n=1 Tax=Desulfobaculum xiamenense TaxID=995050 RepID=A0A846QLF3_9BACT|nr:RluA family pseudouridine synthase [Desulfobaculum xiamenense]NJB68017.1 23S rRNA pseudouridine955/2504/2580 synthase [Desulfobaculum xiamenense]
MPPVQHLEVTPDEGGQKLLQFLQRRLGADIPRSLVMRLIRTGQVRVDGGRRKPFDRIEAGQVVRVPPIRIDEPASASPSGLPPLRVLLHRDGLLAIAKPAGLAVHPGSGHEDCLTARLAAQFPDAPFAPTPAHRLDRDTSGVLLCATSYETLRDLQDAFRVHDIDKVYLCWVHGAVPVGTVMDMRDELAKTGPEGRERVHTGDGRDAHARAECLLSTREYSLMAVTLFTGRTHQIRVQLSSRGLPIVGDRKYGRTSDRSAMLLHAWRIRWKDDVIEMLPDWEGAFRVKPEALI